VSLPEGNTHPPARSPQEATGPGDLSWRLAHDALDAYEYHADHAYTDAVATGSLPLSDNDLPHLAEGQYSDWHWASDDTITRGMPAIKAEVA
jgi:hypothetical protein